jgi:hypothetical protein
MESCHSFNLSLHNNSQFQKWISPNDAELVRLILLTLKQVASLITQSLPDKKTVYNILLFINAATDHIKKTGFF